MKDFDMRTLVRVQKDCGKKLTGFRKRKEKKLADNLAGTDFKFNADDDRFSALLEGTDDRFGIDLTDSRYKETIAMKEILSEQTKRRKTKR